MKILKKISVVLLTMILCVSTPIAVFAQATVKTSTDIQYLDDGSYFVTEMEECISPFTTYTRKQGKTVTYYNGDDEKQWSVTIWGTFQYTGSSATCTIASTSYNIFESAWKVTEAKATKSGRTATGDFVVKKYWLGIITKTVPVTVIISCDNNGNIG